MFKKVFESIGKDNLDDAFINFYSQFNTKDEQDLFLHDLIDVMDIVRKRPGSRDIKGNSRDANEDAVRKRKSNGGNKMEFKYHVLEMNEYRYVLCTGMCCAQVCVVAFLSIFSVSEKGVRRVRGLKMDGKAVKDLRGVHTSYITSLDILAKVYAHIDFFPKKLIHYGGKARIF